MIRRDGDDVAAQSQVRAVVDGSCARARVKAAAVTPHDHRPFAIVRDARRPDIEREAVLAFSLSSPRSLLISLAARARLLLRSSRGVVERVAHAGPCGRVGWRHEAVLPARARAVRNTFEDVDAASLDTAHSTERGFGLDRARLRPTRPDEGRRQRSCDRALYDEVAA
jgi:hypothetical protein